MISTSIILFLKIKYHFLVIYFCPQMYGIYVSLFITIDLYNIRRIRKYLSYDNRKSIVQAIIMSQVDYCNGLLYGTPTVHLGKLQRMRNAAARLVCTVSRYNHITPSLIKLHWLPVTHRIEFKIATLLHKIMYLWRCTTVSFRLDKNHQELAVSVEITPGHISNG